MSQLAAFALVLFTIHLFRQDVKCQPASSPALWVPLLWVFLAGSRWVSSWLDLGGPSSSVDAYSEGSPVDRAVFLALIAAGLVVLARREIEWGRLLWKNKLLVAYFLYCLLSIGWSDDPFVAFKRWFKDLGNPIMALVILTDSKPLQALATVLRRLSYLLLPLSVLFVKYYPELGRVYHYDGSPMYTGVGHQKNDLGLMCLVTGTYFCWQILQQRDSFLRWPADARRRLYILLTMMAWLLYMSNSQTSLACLLVAVAILLAARTPPVKARPSRLVGLLTLAALSLVALEASLGLKAKVLELLGRDPSLTNRTELWKLLFDMSTDPVFGSGFMSFWIGDRMEHVWKVMGTVVNQAHSGYLEQYLNLGYVGVVFIVALMGVGLFNVWRHLRTDAEYATLRLCFIAVAALYNYTEASFYGINNMWVLLLIGILHVPPVTAKAAGPSAPWKRMLEGWDVFPVPHFTRIVRPPPPVDHRLCSP